MKSCTRIACLLWGLAVASTQAFGPVLQDVVYTPLLRCGQQPCLKASRIDTDYSTVPKTTLDTEAIQARLSNLGIKNSSTEVLSTDPLVYRVFNLLSVEECDAYKEYVADRNMTLSNPPEVSLEVSKLWPLPFIALGAGVPPYFRLATDHTATSDLALLDVVSVVVPNIATALFAMGILARLIVLPLMKRFSQKTGRTSVAVALNQEGKDMEFCRAFVERASAAAPRQEHPWYAWEAPVVTRYDPGSIFARHGDASPTRGSEWKDSGGQRVLTCICYLNTLEDTGGETSFNQLGFAVRPIVGSALFFVPANPQTWKADARTEHESLPATEDKWIVQLFGRAQRVPPPLGLPDSFGE